MKLLCVVDTCTSEHCTYYIVSVLWNTFPKIDVPGALDEICIPTSAKYKIVVPFNENRITYLYLVDCCSVFWQCRYFLQSEFSEFDNFSRPTIREKTSRKTFYVFVVENSKSAVHTTGRQLFVTFLESDDRLLPTYSISLSSLHHFISKTRNAHLS